MALDKFLKLTPESAASQPKDEKGRFTGNGPDGTGKRLPDTAYKRVMAQPDKAPIHHLKRLDEQSLKTVHNTLHGINNRNTFGPSDRFSGRVSNIVDARIRAVRGEAASRGIDLNTPHPSIRPDM